MGGYFEGSSHTVKESIRESIWYCVNANFSLIQELEKEENLGDNGKFSSQVWMKKGHKSHQGGLPESLQTKNT